MHLWVIMSLIGTQNNQRDTRLMGIVRTTKQFMIDTNMTVKNPLTDDQNQVFGKDWNLFAMIWVGLLIFPISFKEAFFKLNIFILNVSQSQVPSMAQSNECSENLTGFVCSDPSSAHAICFQEWEFHFERKIWVWNWRHSHQKKMKNCSYFCLQILTSIIVFLGAN